MGKLTGTTSLCVSCITQLGPCLCPEVSSHKPSQLIFLHFSSFSPVSFVSPECKSAMTSGLWPASLKHLAFPLLSQLLQITALGCIMLILTAHTALHLQTKFLPTSVSALCLMCNKGRRERKRDLQGGAEKFSIRKQNCTHIKVCHIHQEVWIKAEQWEQ